ncbi:hypothetical protein [Paenibacillus dauci]|uniref:hypothetical protein n=1 Tax=Paenibacillus dauci TaxID=1567106 RepID=UPI0006199056|nr:hypothetical protein [Paenibacillus dauci]
MDKDTLLMISNSLNCEYEIGIWSEANDFLERQKNIVDFTITYDEGQYNVLITLLEYNLNTVKELFASLVRFLEYNSTFYLREDTENNIQYYLLSATQYKKAFLFYIIFQ